MILVMNAEMSLGMLLAFFVFRLTVRQRLFSIVSAVVYFKSAGFHAERISEIFEVSAENKKSLSEDHFLMPKHAKIDAGVISLENISFRYGNNEAYIFKNYSLDILEGQITCFVGRSGVGKSSLLNLIMCLDTPTEGKIFFNGKNIIGPDLESFKNSVSVVLQEDTLFDGTISDNIAYFEKTDVEKIWESIAKVGLKKEIENMPLGINTLLSANGAGLSSGQRQRLFLARALYRAPKILILDEGTANLDPVSDKLIASLVKEMGITVICAAHKSEIIEIADRVINLEDEPAFNRKG